MIKMTLKQAEALSTTLSTKAGKSYKWLDKKIEAARTAPTPVAKKKVTTKKGKK